MASVQGSVEVRRAGETQWRPAQLSDTYCPGDSIRVGERSRADLALINQPVLRLDQNTTITLGGLRDGQTSLIDLLAGAAHFFSRVTRALEVRTAFVNAGVEGTEFYIRVEQQRTFLSIFEGRVLTSNDAGSLSVTTGQSAVAEAGQAPVLQIVVRPRDAVRWALYYPPVLYFQPEDFQADADWPRRVRESVEFYTQGDFQGAFERIEPVPDDLRDPRFFTYRASLLLAVGRLDEAEPDIQRALSLDSNYSNAFALQSIIAVVQNQKERALDLARRAVAADPQSAAARIDLSYAQQANFDLEGALQSLQEAVELDSEDALAWARLAELWLSFGELDEALEAAQRAVDLNPNLSRTQTVLGFAYLTQVKTSQARAAFERAIELDQADPLPRLGLGLAKIREGDLSEGRSEIEIAVSLDPDNSLIRSYLGKAYFEEKRDELVSDQYAAAKDLDPLDPTPYFYDAIRKQTLNRPVEALQEIQEAIELNDNRAVYRSRLLLDSDLAARSASLARIYTDLGFQQLALVEGWKSVNTDPSNYSAHRFLADSYSVLPRHEIARVSELFQSQMLQPLNLTPIQPRLAESNLFLISAGGPGALSFNEFNPLFNRDGIVVQPSGFVGQNDSGAGEGVIAGIYKKASFSVGYTRFKTEGWRENADQNDDIANAFLQLELTDKTSIQGEYRYRHTEKGDLLLRFFPDSFFPGERNKEKTNFYRAGVRQAFSPDSILLGSFTYQKAAAVLRDEQVPPPNPFVTVTLFQLELPDERSFSGEVEHLFRSQRFNLTSGAGYFDIDGEIEQTIEGFASFPPPPIGPGIIDISGSEKIPTIIHHANVYSYAYLHLAENATFTVGASLDSLSGDFPGEDKDQFNPKFGMTWNPLPATTIRAAAFRVLRRTLSTNQTLEPTQVAGFNQFFDDFNLTEAWRYGGALDQKLSRDVFGGVEFSKRDLTVPFLDFTVDPPPTREADWNEYLGRGYLFWTPHEWVGLRGEYQFERLRRDVEFPEGVTKVNTHRIPLGISFFHPSGLSAFVTATYFNQDGEFGGITATDPIRPGEDNFVTVDAGLSYRLPQRYGFFTVGATNLFDREFNYFDSDLNNASIQPDRVVFLRVTLSLP